MSIFEIVVVTIAVIVFSIRSWGVLRRHGSGPDRLELAFLKSDLLLVNNLLEEAKAVGDPVGKIQYRHRKLEIERKIVLLETPDISDTEELPFDPSDNFYTRVW